MPYPNLRSQYSHHYTPHSQRNPGLQQEVSPQTRVNRQPSPMSAHRRVPPQNAVQPQRRRKRRRQPRSRNVLIAGSSMLALAALVVQPQTTPENAKSISNACVQKVESQSVLSRAELSQLLAMPERSPKDAIQRVVSAPYCTLNTVEVREDKLSEREAYPLEFDPQTWLIVLYEEGEYAGYDFSFQRD